MNLLELALSGSNYESEKSYITFLTVLHELSKYEQVPVVYIIDEHNEIWKNKKQESQFFRVWTVMAGSAQGVCCSPINYLLFYYFIA